MSSNPHLEGSHHDSYFERVKHYFKITNLCHLLATDKILDKAKEIANASPRKKSEYSESEIRSAEALYESAHHPITGERRPWITRMSSQAPIKALTIGGMLAYQETLPQLIFWQWLHQTVTSLIDYYNRGSVPGSEIGNAYSASTAGAVGTAFALHSKLMHSSPFARRFIPLAAVTVGTAINVPMIKIREMSDGIPVETKAKRPVGISKVAGLHSAIHTAFSRLFQVEPALVLVPLILNHFERKNMFCKQPALEVVYAIGLTGLLLFLVTPFVLASHGERIPVNPHTLEENIRKAKGVDKESLLYFNREIL